VSTMRFTPPLGPPGRHGGPLQVPTTYEWSGPRRRTRHTLALAALTLLAVAGVATVLGAAARLALDVDLLVVRSGSMEPAIPVGSLVLTRPIAADRIEVGDVVSVVRDDGSRLTHRVVAVEASGALHRLTTQGDANSSPDSEAFTAEGVERVVAVTPGLGRALQLRDSTPVQLVAGALFGALLCWGFGPQTARRIGRWVPVTGPTSGAAS